MLSNYENLEVWKLAHNFTNIRKDKYEKYQQRINQIQKMLMGLIKSLQNKTNKEGE